MKRIEFLKHLAGIIMPGWLIPGALMVTGTGDVKLYDGWVAGYRYYEGPAVEGNLYVGRRLRLHREPGNPYDEKAIEIYAGDHKLGYISRSDNTILSRLLDQHVPLQVRVGNVQPEAPTWKRVKVCVGMNM